MQEREGGGEGGGGGREKEREGTMRRIVGGRKYSEEGESVNLQSSGALDGATRSTSPSGEEQTSLGFKVYV
jgi:hypothetical protein